MNDNYAQGTPTASIRIDESDKPVVVKTVYVSQDSIDEIAEAVAKKLRQPERKKGKWTEDEACEFCGFQPWYENDIHTLSFCSNCGADLRGDTE